MADLSFESVYQALMVKPLRYRIEGSNGGRQFVKYYGNDTQPTGSTTSPIIPLRYHDIQNWIFLVNFAKFVSRKIYHHVFHGYDSEMDQAPHVVTVMLLGTQLWVATSVKGPRNEAFATFEPKLKDLVGSLDTRFPHHHKTNMGCGEFQVVNAVLSSKNGLPAISSGEKRCVTVVTVSCANQPPRVMAPCSHLAGDALQWGCNDLMAALHFTVIDTESAGQEPEGGIPAMR